MHLPTAESSLWMDRLAVEEEADESVMPIPEPSFAAIELDARRMEIRVSFGSVLFETICVSMRHWRSVTQKEHFDEARSCRRIRQLRLFEMAQALPLPNESDEIREALDLHFGISPRDPLAEARVVFRSSPRQSSHSSSFYRSIDEFGRFTMEPETNTPTGGSSLFRGCDDA